jgi:epoxyqueuosine reductase QueG
MFARGIGSRSETAEKRFEPREGNVNAELDEILELTPETYAARFRGSAMKRAKLGPAAQRARVAELQDSHRWSLNTPHFKTCKRINPVTLLRGRDQTKLRQTNDHGPHRR